MREIQSPVVRVGLLVVSAVAAWCGYDAPAVGAEPGSTYRVVEVVTSDADGAGDLAVDVRGIPVEGDGTERPLAVRAIVTASDGSHPDGSGKGVYRDGRFFADGSFVVQGPAGRTTVALSSGPNFVPLSFEVELESGKRTVVEAELAEWFRPQLLGWYSGDNHVHTQHDANAAVKTDLRYMALQARADGLDWVTEAGSNTSYDLIDKLDTDRFLLRYAPELRPGAFIGHINTPGIDPPLSWGEWTEAQKRVLPVYHLLDEVHKRGGVVAHTHPLTPVTQLHWMGATEVLSDAVLGKAADLLDQDYPASRQLYYSLLNLGQRIGVSGYTDAALGRRQTLSPGDRRVYAKSDGLDYRAMVAAMGAKHTAATSGGPLFAELDVEGEGPGGTVVVRRDEHGGASVHAAVKIHSLNPLKEAMLVVNGRPVKRFDVKGKTGHLDLEADVALTGDRVRAGLADWVLVYTEAEPNHWAITSPVWLEGGANDRPQSDALGGGVVVFQVSNAERLSKLTHNFFAHMIVSVGHGRSIGAVELLRDGEVVRRFTPDEGDHWDEGRVPVSQMPGPYGPGWAWLMRNTQGALMGGSEGGVGGVVVHFQADWPVTENGWYSVRVTEDGRGGVGGSVWESDALRFDAEYPMSREMSIANLRGPLGDRFTLHGYGEEMPLADIPDPWTGDHWWYPNQTWWRMTTVLSGYENELRGGSFEKAKEWFRVNGKE